VNFLKDRFLDLMTNGMFASAFTALLVFLGGMIIVYFTPDNPSPTRKPLK
jgi:hypothetical protein